MISDGWWLWCMMMMVMIVTQMITWWYSWSYDMSGAYIPWSWWLADLLVDWRSTIFINYSSLASIFISYSLHQLQLSHPASSSQLPFAIDAKGVEMFRGRDVLVRGSSPWGGACCQLSSMTKGEIVGQVESCMVWLCLVFVIDVNWVLAWGLVLCFSPLWIPSCVLFVVVSGRPFPQIQAQVWSHLEPLKWVKRPSGLGKSPSGCVCGLSSHYFIISHDQYFIIFLKP